MTLMRGVGCFTSSIWDFTWAQCSNESDDWKHNVKLVFKARSKKNLSKAKQVAGIHVMAYTETKVSENQAVVMLKWFDAGSFQGACGSDTSHET